MHPGAGVNPLDGGGLHASTERLLDLRDVEEVARASLTPELWDFVGGGSGTESTLRSNIKALNDLGILPRVAAGAGKHDMGMRLLGSEWSMPMAVAPMAYQRLLHPEGELAVARAAAEARVVNVVSMLSSTALSLLTAPGGPTWAQLYWLRDRKTLLRIAAEAEDAGCRALVLSMDVPRMGRRVKDMRHALTLPFEVSAASLAGGAHAEGHRRAAGSSALMTHMADLVDPTLSWDDIAWLRERTGLPLVLKGILHPEDAARACESGVDAIVVSNHGGRQLDGAVAAVTVLAEIRRSVAGRCPVLFDSGIRSGVDVVKVLALGASAVLVGRPVLWGLAIAGRQGVDRVLAILREELEDAMALSGCADLAAVRRLTCR